MNYKRIAINTTTKDAEMISVLLMDHGVNDVQIEDNVQLTDEELNQMYADFVKELPPDDGKCKVIFFTEEEFDNRLEAKLNEEGKAFNVEPVTVEVKDVDSADWEDKWKEYFKPFNVDDIYIVPTWETLPEEADERAGIIIRLDPGMAFGTGTHETTRLCLKEIGKYIKDKAKVLDIGCGSGILGIAAAGKGAAGITELDIDDHAIEVAKENFEINNAKADFFVGDAAGDDAFKNRIKAEGPFDILTVNILADIIKLMLPDIHEYMKKDGVLITSGILASKEDMIRGKIDDNPNLKYIETIHDGDWVMISARRI